AICQHRGRIRPSRTAIANWYCATRFCKVIVSAAGSMSRCESNCSHLSVVQQEGRRMAVTRILIFALVGWFAWVDPLPAQQGIQQGTMRKVDTDKGVITVLVDGKNVELSTSERTKIWDIGMQELADGLKIKAIREGARVMFKTGEKDGKTVLIALKLAGDG